MAQPAPPPASHTSGGGSGKAGLATALAAVAIVIAIVAVGISFVVPGPTGAKGSTGSQGTTGNTGAQGNQGAPGAPFVTLWAVVNATGNLTRGSGANNSSTFSLGVGSYQVGFYQNVTNCSYTATLGLVGSVGQAPPGSVTVTGRAGTPDAVYVATFANNTTQYNESFHLVVECGGNLWAVVNATGTLARGSGVINSTLEDVGAYAVVFDQNVTNCAYEATLGLTGSVGSAPPGSITVTGLFGAPDGVYVATFNATGFQTNESFQMSVFC